MSEQKTDYKIIGGRTRKADAVMKVTGTAGYGADTYLPGMLYGKVLRSTVPHAIIKNIDFSEALKLPGVKAVCSAEDFPPDAMFGFSAKTRDQTPLARGKVRFIGDEICAVAATDLDTAEAALDLIKVEYEELPAVFDPYEAMKEGAPLVHEAMEGNICSEYHNEIGSVEEGFAQSDLVMEDTFRTVNNKHGFIEPHAAVGQWNPVTNKATIWANKQSPYVANRKLAMGIGVKPSNLRLIQTFVGGGFGASKSDPCAGDFCCLMLSKKAGGRPVKIVYTMDDVLISGEQRHPFYMTVKMGMKKDGTIMALQCDVMADGGAFSAIGPISIALPAFFADLPYHIPNMKYDAVRVFTNKSHCGSFRGHGVTQIKFAIGQMMDEMCNKLGLDMGEVSINNAVHTGETTPRGWHINSCGFTECVEQTMELAQWKEKRGKLPKYKGIGMATSAHYTGVKISGHNSSSVVLKMNEDGTCQVLTGVTDIGQGAVTAIAMIVAECLGLRMQDIVINFGTDSDTTPVDPGTYGSRVTFMSGNAAIKACDDIKRQIGEEAASIWGVPFESIVFRDRKVMVEGDEEKVIDLGKIVRNMEQKKGTENKTIWGVGNYDFDLPFMDFHTGKGNASPAYAFSCDIVELEVDPETGKYTLLNVVGAHDVGKVLNRTICEGQVEGSWVQIQGMAMFEDLKKSPTDGHVLNPSFMDYKLPTSMDIPLKREHSFVESHDPNGPFGAKEAGEGPAVGILHAIANALYDATGVRFKEVPITPEKVLKALKEKENKELTRC